jgi:hypothetical protein
LRSSKIGWRAGFLEALANQLGEYVVAAPQELSHPGRTTARKRVGTTVKISVSFDARDVAALKKRAKESYGGNLSAAFGEAAKWLRQQDARKRVIDAPGRPILTPEGRAALDAEQAEAPRTALKKV